MDAPTLYDDDVYAWATEQAALLRRLAAERSDLPNALDLANIAEEIESVGRSELATAKSQIRNMLRHLWKAHVDARSQAVPKWRAEIRAFHDDLMGTYTPAMRHLIELEGLWEVACRIADDELDGYGIERRPRRPRCPFTMDDLLAPTLDLDRLLKRLEAP